MPINLDIDEALLSEALRLSGQKTELATVHQALREFIQKRKQLETVNLFGHIVFDSDYDYKKGRHRS